MKKWQCSVCGYIYDESREEVVLQDLPENWSCPVCGAPKSAFKIIEGEVTISKGKTTVAEKIIEQLVAYRVKRVYGIPGHSNLPLTDAIRQALDSSLPSLVEILVDSDLVIQAVHRV